MAAPLTIPFGDLKRQTVLLRAELDAAVAEVLDSGMYILGKQVSTFEQEFAAYCGANHCIGVASGAEALYLALVAHDIQPGDEVITVANACMYQVAAILQAGARPVLVEVDPVTNNMDPSAFEAAITVRTRAVIPVDLFGRLADLRSICAIASRHKIAVIEDAAQAHGSWAYDAEGAVRKAGAWGSVACFSFYPSKNLGAIGDGGALVTNDPALAERLRRLRMYGWSSKYNTTEANGRNSRLDELQAALLRVKLRHLDQGNAARRQRAAWYAQLLGDLPIAIPADDPGHVYHLYVISVAGRDALRRHLLEAGIGCDVHYPIPAHRQPAYAELGYPAGALPTTERLATEILSLPMYPELLHAEIEQIAAVVRAGVGR